MQQRLWGETAVYVDNDVDVDDVDDDVDDVDDGHWTH